MSVLSVSRRPCFPLEFASLPRMDLMQDILRECAALVRAGNGQHLCSKPCLVLSRPRIQQHRSVLPEAALRRNRCEDAEEQEAPGTGGSDEVQQIIDEVRSGRWFPPADLRDVCGTTFPFPGSQEWSCPSRHYKGRLGREATRSTGRSRGCLRETAGWRSSRGVSGRDAVAPSCWPGGKTVGETNSPDNAPTIRWCPGIPQASHRPPVSTRLSARAFRPSPEESCSVRGMPRGCSR